MSLFHEALGEEAARDLPAYWGRQSRMFASEIVPDQPDCWEGFYSELNGGDVDDEVDYDPAKNRW